MDLNVTKARIRSLRDQLSQLSLASRQMGPRPNYLHTDPLTTGSCFSRFVPIRDALIAERADLFGDLPNRPLPDPLALEPMAHDGRGMISASDTALWVADMDYCLTILDELDSAPASSVKVSREGIFFAGQYFDALLRFTEIVAAARTSIDLIDGYVDEKVLDLLSNKSASVHVRVLTFKTSPSFLVAAGAFVKQYGGLEVRTSNGFHDRFVIADSKEYFHFGASIKDLGNRGFMFSRIEEPDVMLSLEQKFTSVWGTATIAV